MIKLKIYSWDYYLKELIDVKQGEQCRFTVASKQKWIDFIIPSTVKGYNNLLLKENKKRLQGVKCFALCGTLEKDEEDHFYYN